MWGERMERLYCEIHFFDLHQKVYIINSDNGLKKEVAITTIEDLPKVVTAIGADRHISKVILSGNKAMNNGLAADIIAYSKQFYGKNIIEVEVI